MAKIEKEVRSFDIEFRAPEESRRIEGYGAIFNSRSHDLGGFVEVIDPRAFDEVIEKSDCKLVLNHDEGRGILGRCRKGSGSLKLTVDDKGLRFETDAPKTALGEEALEYLRRGDADQCSFAFTVADDKWERQADDTYLRTILRFDRLYDVSILTCTPAYEATSVACRSFEEFKEKEAAELEEARKAEEERQAEEQKKAEEEAAKAEEARKEAVKAYYENLRKENEKYLN